MWSVVCLHGLKSILRSRCYTNVIPTNIINADLKNTGFMPDSKLQCIHSCEYTATRQTMAATRWEPLFHMIVLTFLSYLAEECVKNVSSLQESQRYYTRCGALFRACGILCFTVFSRVFQNNTFFSYELGGLGISYRTQNIHSDFLLGFLEVLIIAA